MVVLGALAAAGAHFWAALAALWLASQHVVRRALALTVRMCESWSAAVKP